MAWATVAACGCAMLPPPPAGPPPGAGQLSYAMTVGLNAAPAHATVVTDAGVRHQLSGNGDMAAGKYDLLGMLANPRFAMRLASRADVDAGLYAGGWDAGAGARYFFGGDPAGASLPVAVTAGAQVGYALFVDRALTARPWQVQAGIELHPFIPGYGPSLVGLGVSYGRRRHGFLVPKDLVPEEEEDRLPLTHTDFEIARDELRLELSLGTVISSSGKPVATLTVMPYLVAAARAPRGACLCAGNPRLESFAQLWGVALIVGPIAFFNPGTSAAP